MTDVMLTAKTGKNEDQFPDILRLYAKPGDRIADVTYGKGNFWKKVDISSYELFPSDLSTGTDCRHTAHDDESMNVWVLDPPYIYNPKDTVKASISSPYAVNETGIAGGGLTTVNAVVGLYRDAMVEAARGLRFGGFLIVKCQDQIEAGKQRWVHIELYQHATTILSLYARDLFVMVQATQPTIRWPIQRHARKNHSYFWVFEKKSHRK